MYLPDHIYAQSYRRSNTGLEINTDSLDILGVCVYAKYWTEKYSNSCFSLLSNQLAEDIQL